MPFKVKSLPGLWKSFPSKMVPLNSTFGFDPALYEAPFFNLKLFPYNWACSAQVGQNRVTPQLALILLPPKLVGIRAFLRYPHANVGVNDRLRLVANLYFTWVPIIGKSG
jgi:hypothetical protein